MESQKLIGIILAVSFFAVAVIGLGLVFFRPQAEGGTGGTVYQYAAASNANAAASNANAAASNANAAASNANAAASTAGSAATTAATSTADQFGNLESFFTDSGTPATQDNARPGSIQSTEITYGGVGDTGPQAVFERTPATAATATVRTTVTPAARPATATRPEQPAATAATPAPTTRTVNSTEYWIQVGSFGSREHADTAHDTLARYGLTPSLTTTLSGDRTLYRVRTGPFSDQDEAEKFLAWIAELDGFEGSYVSRVAVQRTVTR